MTGRLPHQINSEDLLKALENATDDKQELTSFSNDVPFFLSKFKIETGEFLVKRALLYKLYRLYSEDPVNQTQFTLTCSNFVLSKLTYFCINVSVISILKTLRPQTNSNYLSSSLLKKHYELFLEKENVTSGTKWVEGYLLFEVYRFYCIDAKIKTRLRYENFIVISKLYFEHKRIGDSRGFWFRMHPDTLSKLSEEHKLFIKNKRSMSEKEKRKRRPKGKKQKIKK